MKKKLRICHFTYSFFPAIGGMEEVIHKLSLMMLENNIEPHVFAPHVRGRENTLDVPYNVIRYQRPSSRDYGVQQLLIPLFWHHRKYRFDILHCHSIYPPGYISSLFRKIQGVPFLITSHGGDLKENSEGHIINAKITRRIKKFLPEAGAVTVVSSEMKTRILRFGIDPARTHVIANGISVGEFKQSCNAGKSRNPYILYLGRLREDKGADIALLAFSLLRQQNPDIRLKIAGDGREKDNLQKMSAKLSLNRHVDFLGSVKGTEKTGLLRDALFLICPSRREAFGIVNLEAFASGLPVVASKVGGIPDTVNDGENGFLVEPGNPAQLAEKMQLLIENPALRERMSGKALQKAAQYDWKYIIQEYIALYKSIL
jgi:glycosyltransferase involved in cell wall biosynthesis